MINPVGPRHPNAIITDQPKGNPVQEENNFEEGTEAIPLPSKGVFYHPPFFCKEEINVRPLDWRDEDVLTTRRFIEDGSVFDKIVNQIIQDKDISAYKLVPIDRDTILLWLRTMAFGKDLEIKYTCPDCEKENIAKWDISKLEIPKYSDEILEELKINGELKIQCPLSNLIVYVKVPSIDESRDTEKRYKKKKADGKIEADLNGTASLMMVISGIEVEPEKIIRKKEAIVKYFEEKKLSIMDSRFIRKSAKLLNLEYDTKQDLKCSCGYVQEGVEMPIVHQNFLWLEPNL